MNTIDEKVRDISRWRKAQENLDDFYKMMELIKQYPVNPMEPAPSPQWTIPEPYIL
jgi:hypothetical protein